jgi:hypothetical protein
MQDLDGLIAQCIARNPRARKRLREVAWEELWAAGGEHVPDFSTLPKEIWGMIAARCDVSRATLTTLLLLNKERISAVAWTNFRFPPTWDYVNFSRRYLFRQEFRSRPGWTRRFWEIVGARTACCIFKPVERHAAVHVAKNIWHAFPRTTPHTGRPCVTMRALSNKTAILVCISRLISVYVPLHHGKTICVMFQNLGCSMTWTEDITRNILGLLRSSTNEQKRLPPELSAIEAVFTRVDIALGYYNAYRAYTWKDYGVRLPKIELKDEGDV